MIYRLSLSTNVNTLLLNKALVLSNWLGHTDGQMPLTYMYRFDFTDWLIFCKLEPKSELIITSGQTLLHLKRHLQNTHWDKQTPCVLLHEHGQDPQQKLHFLHQWEHRGHAQAPARHRIQRSHPEWWPDHYVRLQKPHRHHCLRQLYGTPVNPCGHQHPHQHVRHVLWAQHLRQADESGLDKLDCWLRKLT